MATNKTYKCIVTIVSAMCGLIISIVGEREFFFVFTVIRECGHEGDKRNTYFMLALIPEETYTSFKYMGRRRTILLENLCKQIHAYCRFYY